MNERITKPARKTAAPSTADPEQAASELRQQWRAFDTALSHTPDFNYTFDLNGRFTYINRALLSLWNKPLQEALGKNFHELDYPPELAARLQRQIQEVIETKEMLRDSTLYTGADGRPGYYEYIFVPVLGEHGQVEAVTGSTRDITEHVRMKEAVAESEKKLQQVFSQAPVAILVLRGPELTVELANPPYLAIVPGRDLVGRPFAEVMPEFGKQVWSAFRRVAETGEPFIANELQIAHDYDGDGYPEDRWFNVVCNPLHEMDGAISGIMAVLADVTAQVSARKEVDRVNRELEEFAYVASHDLQEPLRMVSIYSQLLVERTAGDDPEAQQYAQFVTQGARRMETLIRNVLTYSQTVQMDELPVGTTNLNEALDDAITVLKDKIDAAGATIQITALPCARGDGTQLSLIFQNLIANSITYGKRGLPPEIVISGITAQGRCIVAVKDNGIGFDQKHAQRIFRLFKRLHNDEYPGTGLGLAICQRIVERYGGRMWAESALGIGSTFYFELPLAEGTAS